MILKSLKDIPAFNIDGEGFSGVSARWALTKDDGCPNYAMRVIEFAPGGHTSLHAHMEEHELYFPEGEPAIVDKDGNEIRLTPGAFVYMAPNEMHQIKNLGQTPMRIICTIPILSGGNGKVTHNGSGC